MKTKGFVLFAICLSLQLGQAVACSTCFGNYPGSHGEPPPSAQHMAIAIWVMLGAIMSVLSGVGAFSFHLWKHAHMPLEPHQELTEEDLNQYD